MNEKRINVTYKTKMTDIFNKPLNFKLSFIAIGYSNEQIEQLVKKHIFNEIIMNYDWNEVEII